MATTFTVRFTATKFNPGDLLQSTPMQFTTDDLAHALFTTGRAPGDVASHGVASFWELVHRVALIPAYMRRTGTGELTRSRLALELDRSEKIGLSYALGQALTSIFCRQVIGTRYLMHVDRYAKQHKLAFALGQSRPDLFGMGPNGWVVAEAKGRSNALDSGLRTTMVAQKRMVTAVGSDPINLALGCCASFPPRTGTLRVDAVDPKEATSEPIALRGVDLDGLVLAYYAPFIVGLDQSDGAHREGGLTYVDLPTSALRVGLLAAVEARVRAGMRGEVRGLADDVNGLLRAPAPLDAQEMADAQDSPAPDEVTDAQALRADRDLSQIVERFGDGTVVESGWDEALAVRDWG